MKSNCDRNHSTLQETSITTENKKKKKKSMSRNCFPMKGVPVFHWPEEPPGFQHVLVKDSCSQTVNMKLKKGEQDDSYAPLAGIFKNVNVFRMCSLCTQATITIWSSHSANQSALLYLLRRLFSGVTMMLPSHARHGFHMNIDWNIERGSHFCWQVSYFCMRWHASNVSNSNELWNHSWTLLQDLSVLTVYGVSSGALV